MSGVAGRAVISGIGVVSPFGDGAAAFLEGLRAGRSATRAVTLFDPGDLPCRVAAEVPGFDPADHLEPQDRERVGRIVPLAIAAAGEALAAAGLDPARLDGETRRGAAVFVGTGAGAIDFAERQYEAYYREGIRRVNPFAISSSVVGMVSSELSIRFGLRGPSHVFSNGCTSSTDAIGYALHAVRRGDHPWVLAGGAEACITRGMLEGFCRMRAAAIGWNDRPDRASRPFNADRSGFVLGEGAFFLILEEETRARRRGAPILAEVAGYAATCDAHHRVHMSDTGGDSTRAMLLALRAAGASPEEVEYIALHGTSTPQNDRVETLAVKALLGARAARVPASSIKSMIGHAQGACGAAGLLATALGMRHGFLPPTTRTSQDGLTPPPHAGRSPRSSIRSRCSCTAPGAAARTAPGWGRSPGRTPGRAARS